MPTPKPQNHNPISKEYQCIGYAQECLQENYYIYNPRLKTKLIIHSKGKDK